MRPPPWYELWRQAVGVVTRRYGGGLQACRRGGICLKSSGALEAGCMCVDVECRGIELWSSGGSLQVCRRGGVDVWRCAAGV